MADTTLPGVLLKGVAASRPAASAVAKGTIYSATDTGAISQSDGSSWSTYATISSGLSDPMTTRGDIIVRNAANATARLAIGSSGKVLSSDGTDISWATPSGGLAHSYLGYNTVGGTTGTNTAKRIYLKQVTPAASGMLLSVGMYVKTTGSGNTPTIHAGVWDDNSSAPGHLLAVGSEQQVLIELTGSVFDPRWLHIPVCYYLTGGTPYWIGWGADLAVLTIYNDGSGSDQYELPGAASYYGDGGSTFTPLTTTTNKYSLRGDYLS